MPNRWKSMFWCFSRHEDDSPASVQVTENQKLTENTKQEPTLTLKISPMVEDVEAKESASLLSNLFSNDRLFKMLLGRSLALRTDVIFENQAADGTPQSIVVSGKIPIKVSNETRNGQPTKVIQLKGRLRRRRNPADKIPSSTTSGELSEPTGANGGPAGDWAPNTRHNQTENPLLAKSSNPRKSHPATPSASEPLVNRRCRKKRQTRKKEKITRENQSNDPITPSRVVNWSPYFDLASQTGKLGQGTQLGTDWELREKTPVPSPQQSTTRVQKDPSGFLEFGGFKIPESLISSPEGKKMIQKLQKIAGMETDEAPPPSHGKLQDEIGCKELKNLGLNPVTRISITRSRTRFFRYNNGIEYCEKDGKQLLTIDAPEGLYYSPKPR
ncbi:Hypothetical protein NTJ_09303 [Nesidiocoris tenuis]|uniref:Uncharacterized protein n=1 Tax=Nesidiocoris tenuis TaxID=355587 RepID=A0ABN7AWC8_9HEMI|nr:Hypothetical protein NTJ_09303 [Nesidiocoris tenuis]